MRPRWRWPANYRSEAAGSLVHERRNSASAFGRIIKRWPLTPLLLPFAGGIGLVVHIVANVSLPLAVATLALIGAFAWICFSRRAASEVRQRIRRRAFIGIAVGLLATIAYDAVRYAVTAIFSLSFQPLHVMPIFGHLFLGATAPQSLAWFAGYAYHISNGVGFGVAYCFLFRRPGPLTGILWGLGLELAMALLYPSWLRITAMQEFLTVSMIGHITYGCVLGIAARRFLAAKPHSLRGVPDGSK